MGAASRSFLPPLVWRTRTVAEGALIVDLKTTVMLCLSSSARVGRTCLINSVGHRRGAKERGSRARRGGRGRIDRTKTFFKPVFYLRIAMILPIFLLSET